LPGRSLWRRQPGKCRWRQDAWNSRDPERVAFSYSPDSEWRNRTEFLRGREEIKAFLNLMQKRLASINDAPIQREERRVF
jgi:nuclear transport factor 2 (NTF2) superfamily protein